MNEEKCTDLDYKTEYFKQLELRKYVEEEKEKQLWNLKEHYETELAHKEKEIKWYKDIISRILHI